MWLVLDVIIVGVTLRLVGFRPDLADRARDGAFVAELGGLVLAALALALLSLRVAMPSLEPRGRSVATAVALAVLAAGVGLWHPATVDVSLAQFFRAGAACAERTVWIAALPWLALMLAIRRGAPFAATRAGALAGAAAFVVAFALMRLVCRSDDPLHLLIWHAVPVALGIGLSAWVGAIFLTRWLGSTRP